MDLTGKKIAFLGDSITEGHGVENPDNIFWKRLEKNTGALCYGYGIGGTCIAPKHMPAENPMWNLYFGSRVEELIPDADIIVVFGGTNDFGHGDAAFGAYEDQSESSFCGAFRTLLEKLINRYPDKQIITMTPLHRETENELGLNELGIRRDFPLVKYVDAIIELSGSYGIPVLDLYRTCALQPSIPVIKQLYMPDGLHPNDLGHEKIAERLQAFLQCL